MSSLTASTTVSRRAKAGSLADGSKISISGLPRLRLAERANTCFTSAASSAPVKWIRSSGDACRVNAVKNAASAGFSVPMRLRARRQMGGGVHRLVARFLVRACHDRALLQSVQAPPC